MLRSCINRLSGPLRTRHFSSIHDRSKKIRNVAIVAHVDHGKTTLVDQLLKHGGNSLAGERVMDSIDLERERGITIMSKCTRVEFKDYILNIVDTPGHQDFGGEVERILSMVDGVVLVVDGTEGPMPQTKFVLTKALQRGLNPVVVVNKVDRETCRLDDVHNEIFDLFVDLDANDAQLEFPTLLASAKQGWAVEDLETDPQVSMEPLLEKIVSYVPPPKVVSTDGFSMVVTMIGSDSYVGRLVTGRIHSGEVRIGDVIYGLDRTGKRLGTVPSKVTKLFVTRGTTKEEIEYASAGDIITLAGIDAFVSDTVCSPSVTEPLEAPSLDPPTISMTFGVNDSPLGGREGKFLTASHIKARLDRECENNVAISVTRSGQSDAFDVHGRGELQLAILMEEMRREGYELSVSPPRVIFREDEETKTVLEPVEEVIVDVDKDFSGVVMDKLTTRRADLKEFKEMHDKVRMVFHIPSKSLIGYRSEIKTDTHGTGILNSIFHGYFPVESNTSVPTKGKLISSIDGVATSYGLNMVEERGKLFIGPGQKVYVGMIIGEHSRNSDLEVNPAKEKKLTNIRASGMDEAIRLEPPRIMSLEEAVSYLDPDEMIEVTPTKIRMRKIELCPNVRARTRKTKAKAP